MPCVPIPVPGWWQCPMFPIPAPCHCPHAMSPVPGPCPRPRPLSLCGATVPMPCPLSLCHPHIQDPCPFAVPAPHVPCPCAIPTLETPVSAMPAPRVPCPCAIPMPETPIPLPCHCPHAISPVPVLSPRSRHPSLCRASASRPRAVPMPCQSRVPVPARGALAPPPSMGPFCGAWGRAGGARGLTKGRCVRPAPPAPSPVTKSPLCAAGAGGLPAVGGCQRCPPWGRGGRGAGGGLALMSPC